MGNQSEGEVEEGSDYFLFLASSLLAEGASAGGIVEHQPAEKPPVIKALLLKPNKNRLCSVMNVNF